MPSKLYLAGDSEALWLTAPADTALTAVEQGRADSTYFIRLDMLSITRDDKPRPAYFDPTQVAAILPLDQRQLDAEYDDLPAWLT